MARNSISFKNSISIWNRLLNVPRMPILVLALTKICLRNLPLGIALFVIHEGKYLIHKPSEYERLYVQVQFPRREGSLLQ